MAASLSAAPASRCSFANSTNQDVVLGSEGDQHHESDLAIEIEIEAGKFDADIGA